MKTHRFGFCICVLLAFAVCAPVFPADTGKKGPDRFTAVTDRSGEKGQLTLYFIDLDVPQDSKDKSGDSTLVVAPDGKVMLVDCGHPDAGKDVVRTLKALGITKIDIFVNTHPHIDHLGGFPQVADTFAVGQVYRSHVEYDTPYTKAFAAAVQKHSLPLAYLEEEDSFMLGSDVKVDVFGPVKNIVYPPEYPANSTQFLNDESVAMQMTFGESKVLLCGDLYRSGESVVIDKYADRLKSDVAKANHHGNDTSNQKKWVRAVQPQVVVAMNDILGSMDVVNNYVRYGAVFYHTLYNGLVKVQLDNAHHVHTESQFESWIEKVKPAS
jgi:competence protein ComEC